MSGDNDEQSRLRVLVVDDNDEVRRLLGRSLTRLGHDVVVAVDGANALDLLAQTPFQIVITDIRMPGIDGHTLLRRLSAQDLDTAVIVMSGGGTMDDVVDVLRAGAVDYLKKPWILSELVSAIARAEEILGIRRKARATKEAPPPSGVSMSAPVAVVPAAVAPAVAAPPTFASLLEQVRRGEVSLPSAPVLAGDLRAAIARPDANVIEIASLIERDPALATQLLRISNTAAYARLGRNNSIKSAIGRIGIRQIQCLVETITARQCYPLRLVQLLPLQRRIWQDSLAKAICYRALAELLGTASGVEPELAYMTGLLGDAGASFLLWVVGEHSASTKVAPSEGACIELLQNLHQEVGGQILKRWDMAPAVVLVAQSHHADAPPAPPSAYWNLAIVGADLAERITPGPDPTRKVERARAVVDRCASDLQVGTTVMKKLESRVRSEFESMSEALS